MQPGAMPEAVILCGGEGSRLGGVDKPLQSFLGEPLLLRVQRAIAAQVGRMLISANRSAENYAAHGEVVSDGRHGGCGPLAGIAAGLAAARSSSLLCVPGDAPALPDDLVPRLRAAQAGSGAAIVHVFDGVGPQPLCCLIDRRLGPDLERYLDHGGRTPREWFLRHRVVAVDFSHTPRWAWSLNTAAEWAEAELLLRTPARTP